MSRVPIPLLAPCYFNETDSGTDKIFILSLFLFSLNIFFISHPIQLEPFNMSVYALSHSLTFTVTLRPSVQCYPTCLLVTLIAVINLMPWNPCSVTYSYTYDLPILINVNRKIDTPYFHLHRLASFWYFANYNIFLLKLFIKDNINLRMNCSYETSLFMVQRTWKFDILKLRGKSLEGKLHPRTHHEGPEEEERYSCTLSLTGTRWEWADKATPRPIYPRERDPVPIVQAAGWAQGNSGTAVQSVTWRYTDYAIPITLYRLRYTGYTMPTTTTLYRLHYADYAIPTTLYRLRYADYAIPTTLYRLHYADYAIPTTLRRHALILKFKVLKPFHLSKHSPN
jgi:hypothetical protein